MHNNIGNTKCESSSCIALLLIKSFELFFEYNRNKIHGCIGNKQR